MSPETLAWMQREQPERLALKDTPHAFVHGTAMESDRCFGGEGLGGCICDACWEPKSRRVHRWSRQDAVMSEAELIAAHGGLPIDA